MPLSRRCHGTVITFIFSVLLGNLAQADTHATHLHDPLAIDTSLTLGEVVDAAVDAFPEKPVLEARRDQAEAWSRRGRSLTADRPALMLRYQSDRFGSDNGLDEYEAGIELPLWSWGGRSAVKALGSAMTAESEAARAALRWEVAGMVRAALWDVAIAENEHELAEQSLDMAKRLVKTVERRYELGDVAQRDLLLARSSYLDYETALIQAGAVLLDAERSYRTFTGLHRRPGFEAETMSDAEEIAANHPALALADMAVERAEAGAEVTRQTSKAGPTVLLGTRRERPAFGTVFDDSIGVTVNVPFGGRAHRGTDITAAARTASEVRAARSRELRMLTLDMHEAAHSLAVAREKYAAALQRLDIAERQQAMGELAYEKGEIELLDLLKIRETAIAARRLVARLEIEDKRQTALYNQAVGDLP